MSAVAFNDEVTLASYLSDPSNRLCVDEVTGQKYIYSVDDGGRLESVFKLDKISHMHRMRYFPAVVLESFAGNVVQLFDRRT
jgi:hypothetical protein